MAGINGVAGEQAQFAAMAELRLRLLVNTLRSKAGRLEFSSRILAALIYCLGAAGAGAGLGFSAHSFVSHHAPDLIVALLWPVFFSWQVLPVMISSFSDAIEMPGLLRFPLTYRAFVLVHLLFGVTNIGTIFGAFCLTGILIGIAAAKPTLLFPALLILLAFAALNVLLSRMIFAWIERWLAQRRTRELIAALFFVLLLATQLIAPILTHYSTGSGQQAGQIALKLAPVQTVLPPGIAAAAIGKVAAGDYRRALELTAELLFYIALIAGLLSARLRSQYRGENLSEAVREMKGSPEPGPARSAKCRDCENLNSGLRAAAIPASSAVHHEYGAGAVAAMMQKELHYLLRSGPLLITLLTPVFMVVVISSQWLGGSTYRFPLAAAYTLLVLANGIYNCFGGDGAGVQLYLTAPVRMRTIVFAKNLTSICILAFQLAFLFAMIALIYGAPDLQIVVVTFTWIAFSLPINLSVGNLLSFQSPRKINFEKFGRQQSSTLNALTSLGIQVATLGVGAVVLLLERDRTSLWAAAGIFASLSVIPIAIYLTLLNGMDGVALSHRETLIAELCKL